MAETGIIYKVTNLIDGKCYIGKTKKNLDFRKNGHIRDCKNPKTYFHRALIKYGIDNFLWEVWDIDNNNELIELEIYWIDYFRTYGKVYNMTVGGEGGDTWTLQSEHKKQIISKKISDCVKERICNDENFRNTIMKNLKQLHDNPKRGKDHYLYGKNVDDDIKRKISVSTRKKMATSEVREKLMNRDYSYLYGDGNPSKRSDVKKKISVAKTGKLRPDMSGKNNVNYKEIPEYIVDDFKYYYVQCGLSLHHIKKIIKIKYNDSFPLKRICVNNNISIRNYSESYKSMMKNKNIIDAIKQEFGI